MLERLASTLEHYMDLLSARQKLVASNIANIDTPGYKTKDIDFQAEFRALIEGTQPRAEEVAGLAARNDGNNVSMDREARMLAENALRFSLASNLARAEIRAVRAAIQEGRGQ
jgi:flagellar basal-body rod protein FlgB